MKEEERTPAETATETRCPLCGNMTKTVAGLCPNCGGVKVPGLAPAEESYRPGLLFDSDNSDPLGMSGRLMAACAIGIVVAFSGLATGSLRTAAVGEPIVVAGIVASLL